MPATPPGRAGDPGRSYNSFIEIDLRGKRLAGGRSRLRAARGRLLAVEIEWLTDEEEVSRMARSAKMPILVDFFKDG